MKTKLRSIIIGLICLVYVSSAGAAVRVVAYNCANRPNNATEDGHFRAVFQAMGNESVNGIAKRLDILIVSEMDATSATRLTTILNNQLILSRPSRSNRLRTIQQNRVTRTR